VSEHDLKTWPDQYRAILDGRKTFEVRLNDRAFDVGDTLLLKEWDPSPCGYTHREQRVRVTYILRGGQFGIAPSHCVMSIERLP